MTMDEGLIERVDAVRGDVPRVRWIEQAIRQRLGKVPEGSPIVEARETRADQEARPASRSAGSSPAPPPSVEVEPLFKEERKRRRFAEAPSFDPDNDPDWKNQ